MRARQLPPRKRPEPNNPAPIMAAAALAAINQALFLAIGQLTLAAGVAWWTNAGV